MNIATLGTVTALTTASAATASAGLDWQAIALQVLAFVVGLLSNLPKKK